MQSSEQERRQESEDKGNNTCRLVSRRLDELNSHPSYLKNKFSVSASHLAALAAVADVVFQIPLLVTRTGIIIDGYARFELARRQGRESITCLEYDLSEEEALRWLIQSHCPSKGLNGFSRSLLALDLEPSLQERARANRQIGGQIKGSSTLTEAQRIDVRAEIASIAVVSTGSLTKAKQVAAYCGSVIQDAARSGEISVHRACQWSGLARHPQSRKLEEFRSRRGTGIVSRRLIRKYVARMSPSQLIPPLLGDVLKPLTPDRMAVLDTIIISEIDAPGKIAYFTTDAISAVRSLEDPNATS